jgi:hypothetical protein
VPFRKIHFPTRTFHPHREFSRQSYILTPAIIDFYDALPQVFNFQNYLRGGKDLALERG